MVTSARTLYNFCCISHRCLRFLG